MKKYIIFILLTGMTVFVPTSCDFLNDYLDKAPEQGLPEEQIFTRLTNFKLYFDDVYQGTQYYSGNWRDFNIKYCFPIFWDSWDQKYSIESVTDAADMGRYMEGQAWKSGNMSETIVNKLTYDGNRNPVLWSCFTDIRIANVALQKIGKVEDATPEELDDLRGQAYFVRALCHFTLFKFWGPMPYIKKVIGPEDQWDMPRLSKNQTCKMIAADFDSAYFFFNKAGKIRRDPPMGVPNHLAYTPNQMYRPNGMVALAWKSQKYTLPSASLYRRPG